MLPARAALALAAVLAASPAAVAAAPDARYPGLEAPAGVVLDMPWEQARERFIAAGYRPAPIRRRPKDDSTCEYMREACERYAETFTCRLTGLGGCMYLFRRPHSRELVLIGTWGDNPEAYTGMRRLEPRELSGYRY